MARDPYKYFRVEARELLEQLGRGCMDLEKGAGAADLVPGLLRLAHTLKGAARVVKQIGIAEQAHAIEETLAPFREAAATVPRERVDALLKQLDAIGDGLKALAPAGDAATPGKPPPEEGLRIVRADIAEMDALLDGVAEAHTQMTGLRGNLAQLERLRHLMDLLIEQRARQRARAGDGSSDHKAQALADELRALSGGLERGLAASLERLDRELRQVRDAAEQLRLMPADALFMALERTVRDAAQALGKRVIFAGRGGEVRLDASVLGVVQGALLQLVRNAVAHGIETEEARRAAGKPVDGRVTVEIERRGRRVLFRCVDDGGGVDIEAVRRIVQGKGVPAERLHARDAQALLHLLLRGGISTSGAVTEVAGRGIGLDVVRAAAERLDGTVNVRTDAGQGTSVELVVPLSLASLEALVVETADGAAAIPFDAVRRTLRVAPQDLARTAQGESILHDGKTVPFVALAQALDHGARPVRDGRPWSAVIVAGSGGLAAVGVERLRGTVNIMLRPLPELAPAAPVVAGAALDAAGNPQLVLDPDGLVAYAQHAGAPPLETRAAPPPLLVIDDSLTTRMLEQSILESVGYAVDVVASGEEALEQSRRKHYALFLVDIEMPGMDGFAFIEHARADPALRDIPAILVTSRTSASDRRHGQEVGAQDYIVKSDFDQTEFLERIRQLVA